MDSLDDATFLGFDTGQEWNGWACPLFNLDVAMRIVEVAKVWNGARYEQETDEFVFSFGPDEDEERFGAVEVEGQKLYPIGRGSWIWEKVEDGVL